MIFIFRFGLVLFIAIIAAGFSAVEAESIGGYGNWSDPTLHYNQRISLDVKGMDVVDVLKLLVDKGGLNISVGSDVNGRVTLFLKEINVWNAFEIVLLSANLAYEDLGGVLYVMPARNYELKYGKPYGDKRQLRSFNLKNGDAPKIGQFIAQILSQNGKVITDTATNSLVVIDVPDKLDQVSSVIEDLDKPMERKVVQLNYLSAGNAKSKIDPMLSGGSGTLSIDEASNKIIVQDYSNKMREIEKLIAAFDQKPLQVLIDAKIIEIKPFKKFYAGINWDYWIEKYFRLKGDFAIPSPSGVADKVRFGTIGVADVAKKGDYTAIVDFLQTFGETKIISSPRILALNNQEAKILVGTKDVYVTSSTSEIGQSAVTTQNVNFVDVGVKLYVTPSINTEGYVTLKIKPEISSSQRQTIKTDDKETEIPIVTMSEAETTVIVKDGVSVIIGGLRKIEQQQENRGLPFLSKIPLLGAVFSSKKDEMSKNELVILLTPRIISGDKSVEQEIADKENPRQPDSGSRARVISIPKNILAGTNDAPNSSAQAYYESVHRKIGLVADRYRRQDFAGEKVKVKFVIDRSGAIDQGYPIICEQTRSILQKLASEIITEAAPFSSFPASMPQAKEEFEITIMF